MANPVPAPAHPSTTRSGRTRGAVIALALLPLWLLLFLSLAAPGFMDPMFANPPAVVGLPAGIVLLALAMAWMAIGVALILSTWSALGWAVAIVLFMVPAMAAVILGPAVILIALNLAV